MKQNTYTSDGKTKIFNFTFPFFLKSDVIIEIDSKPATNYNLICIKNGLNADIPFIGGEVHFNKPPKLASVITIKRKLSIRRIVDYQPTAKYNPTAHNQDMNYIIEILKDLQDDIESVVVLPSDTDNKNTIDIISGQIAEITSALDEIINNPTGDLSEINNAIETLTNSVNSLNTRCNQLDEQIENLPTATLPANTDYVVASQTPNATNGYTWYRKYKSGWVEQGGIAKINPTQSRWAATSVTFPVKMRDKYYTAMGTPYGLDSMSTLLVCIGGIAANNVDNGEGKNQYGMLIQTESLYPELSSARSRWIQWNVSGIAA